MINNEKMTPKNYAKYDRTYMAFGSVMNGLQGQVKKADIEELWDLCRSLTSDFVDKMYEMEEQIIPVKGTEEVISTKDDIPF